MKYKSAFISNSSSSSFIIQFEDKKNIPTELRENRMALRTRLIEELDWNIQHYGELDSESIEYKKNIRKLTEQTGILEFERGENEPIEILLDLLLQTGIITTYEKWI